MRGSARLREIGDERHGASTDLLDARANLRAAQLVASCDEHRGGAQRQVEGHRFTDAATGAGDEHDGALQFFVHGCERRLRGADCRVSDMVLRSTRAARALAFFCALLASECLAAAQQAGAASAASSGSATSVQARKEPLAGSASAQAAADAQRERDAAALDDLPQRLAARALSEGRTYAKLADLCRSAPQRLSGSPGAARAVEWAAQAMRAEGLENVRLEDCVVPRWERGAPERLEIRAPAELAGERLRLLALGGSVGTPPGGIEAELVVVRSFEELTALGERARGRIVLFDRGMDPGISDPFEAYGLAVNQRTRGAIEAARVGALALLIRSVTSATDDEPHTGAMAYDDAVPRIPAAALGVRSAERLARLANVPGGLRLELELDCRQHEDAPSHNVVGEFVGREKPEEIVLVGAHLDSWDVSEGAHDDGAGCAQALESLRLLRALELRPRRTLRVVLYMNEENGLRGARAYAERHAAQLDKHVLALESDRGGFAPRGFVTDANPAARALIAPIVAQLAPLGAERLTRGGGGADLIPLQPAGVITMGLVPDPQRYFDLHHSARDVLAEVHPRELELGSAAIAYVLYRVAELEQTLPRNEAKAQPGAAGR